MPPTQRGGHGVSETALFAAKSKDALLAMTASEVMRTAEWYAKHDWAVTPEEETQLLRLIAAVEALRVARPNDLARLLRRYPRANGQFSKDQLVAAYHHFCATGQLRFDPEVLRRLQMKPTRTVSGVATVTVLTKPFPCPGECIFCPTDVRMPKSYLHDEPGAIRAEYHGFDPYFTTHSRLRALQNIGHAIDKIELLILGGTWSYYPEDYQTWFVQRCLDALNDVESSSLEEAQRLNETAACRNVGLVIETRPDYIDAAEVQRLRRLGVTKVQLGAQSCDDHILELNKRGHTIEQTRQAVTLLRAAGFKIQLHWMPNLLGATPESDRVDYQRLWNDAGLRPDELKIYPNALVREAELVQWYDRGEFTPYTDDELIELIADCKVATPEYVRLNRIIRDIPKDHIVAGSTASNLREVVKRKLSDEGRVCRCIRCREVRGETANVIEAINSIEYETRGGREIFMSSDTDTGKLAAFLRLSLPTDEATRLTGIDELRGAAIIREVHVYGPVVELGRSGGDKAQHSGLGIKLLRTAEERAREAGYDRLAV
ncbi:MAG TPA: tRNA uridine(34) 5-carboxymethylaminomethyl modification radical SAM/GNAT enzyme Elp3, partial [Anaerolineae bacterium]|nr:tRNA uridine(34) 5-carboxymethylaminomethyl modification radical SAM/GNAT enzyme Elp3 [Anaerolineae bacterium]